MHIRLFLGNNGVNTKSGVTNLTVANNQFTLAAANGNHCVNAFQTRRQRLFYRLAVSNPGPLLPDALRSKLFEPMVSLRESREHDAVHLGLGLHIVRLVAEAHGGSVHVDSDADSGTVFGFELPGR